MAAGEFTPALKLGPAAALLGAVFQWGIAGNVKGGIIIIRSAIPSPLFVFQEVHVLVAVGFGRNVQVTVFFLRYIFSVSSFHNTHL